MLIPSNFNVFFDLPENLITSTLLFDYHLFLNVIALDLILYFLGKYVLSVLNSRYYGTTTNQIRLGNEEIAQR